MNISLLNIISKWAQISFISLMTMFNVEVSHDIVVLNNDIDSKNAYQVTDVINYETEYVYNASIPSGEQNILTEGKTGISYTENGEIKVVEEPINEVIEIGTGKTGVYVGTITGYGPDCVGCSTEGLVSCKTKYNETFSLTHDGIYYEDEEYGPVRILAADRREFPCGTIIEITNSNLNKELGIVMDTGIAMRNAYDQGYILVDLAFEKGALALTSTDRNTTFIVKRWGW
ncbi:MAG: G5 domain-containing protein [Bacilli bacterium]|nr:G5 domain-containing protein [Bacilli bacterium]